MVFINPVCLALFIHSPRKGASHELLDQRSLQDHPSGHGRHLPWLWLVHLGYGQRRQHVRRRACRALPEHYLRGAVYNGSDHHPPAHPYLQRGLQSRPAPYRVCGRGHRHHRRLDLRPFRHRGRTFRRRACRLRPWADHMLRVHRSLILHQVHSHPEQLQGRARTPPRPSVQRRHGRPFVRHPHHLRTDRHRLGNRYRQIRRSAERCGRTRFGGHRASSPSSPASCARSKIPTPKRNAASGRGWSSSWAPSTSFGVFTC